MPELVWLELARADLLAIVDYISDDNPDAAQRLKDDMEAKAQSCKASRKWGDPVELKAPENWLPGRTTSSSTLKTLLPSG